MRAFLFTLLMIPAAFAADNRRVNPAAAACAKKVERLVRETARAMGLKTDFGITWNHESSGKDLMGRPLTTYNSGTFIIEDGYITGSGASAVVRNAEKSCDVIKITVSIGG